MSENGTADHASRSRALTGGPVRVAIRDPHELVVAGLAELITTRNGGVGGRFVLEDPHGSPDVVLYGVRRGDDRRPHDPVLHSLLRRSPATVIATYWDSTSSALEGALSCGAHGALSKRLPGQHLREGIQKIYRGAPPAGNLPLDESCHPEIARSGLTPRQLDVLRLIASGLTNPEIAERLYLTINTVKTYIREGYRKIGATRRSQAVIWAKQHGLTGPDPRLRDVDRVQGALVDRVTDLAHASSLPCHEERADRWKRESAGHRPFAVMTGDPFERAHAQ
ncbi:response regulator transcription factor [Nocardioides sp. GXQ0305]|uniref:helix-turn-helix transcriptional regulator n=1 Tax=Nocardioides sp. GXQ0305 TaxID=3423912 RepID=UPI003D7F01B8